MKKVQSVFSLGGMPGNQNDLFKLKARFSSKNQFYPPEGDNELGHFVVLERVLTVSLVLITVASCLVFGVAVWFRHCTENFLYFMFEDSIQEAKENGEKFTSKFSDRGVNFSVPNLWNNDEEDADEDHLYLGNWVRVLTDLMLTIALLLWTTTISGFLCIYEKNRVFITAFIMSNVVNIFCESVTGGLILGGFEPINDGFRRGMMRVLKNKYEVSGETTLQRITDSIMVVGKCCGINSINDFDYPIASASGQIEDIVLVPRACCKMKKWSLYRKTPDKVLKCLSRKFHQLNGNTTSYFNKRGCYSVWEEVFKENIHVFIYALLGALIGLQLLQTFLASLLYSWTSLIVRLDKDQLRFSSSSSQHWVSGLRATTVSELMVANAHFGLKPDGTRLSTSVC